MRLSWARAGAAALCLGAAGAASADDLPQTIRLVKPAIVAVGSYKKDRAPSAIVDGTGFVVGDGLTVLTAAHVFGRKTVDFERWVIYVGHGDDAQLRDAQILCTDKEHDVATVRFNGAAVPAAKFAPAEAEVEGRDIAFTGYPIGAVLGLYPATARGIISALVPAAIPQNTGAALTPDMIRRLQQNFKVYQLDATAYPGNSGSPLYRIDNGQVVGIVDSVYVKPTKESAIASAVGTPSGITYAIPIRYGRELLAKPGCGGG
ncbi:MAG TPA: serine protease [Aliidongia sp.]|uniref:S1 family peptidase n=1 Tax=Aliidongia sp. TaxID=1914230 RepID=UPI002DDCA07F|nr:serine protease [Aliidongia sp.]HEV2678770.1 serine protease [Aliidongia sp.]